MAVRLILGGSGQGKTRYIMDEVIAASRKDDKEQIYVIVPEQFSLQMQRDLVEQHPDKGFFHVDVLSFFRLAYRVFDECCLDPNEVLEDLGVSILLKKILTEHEDELSYFKKSMRKQGFLDELKSMIMEFVNYGVSSEQMADLSGMMESYPMLSHKCRELALIYRYFQEEIEGQYMIMGQTLELLLDHVEESDLLREGTFYFDGFTGFTPIQLKFLERLIMHAKNVIFTVTIPYLPMGQRNHVELFSFSEKTVQELLNLSEKTGVIIEDTVLLEEKQAPRYESAELAFLESHVLRPVRETWKPETKDIEIVACKSPEEEAEFILHKVEELVRKKGYRYREIAILTGNEAEYIPAFLRQAGTMDIPLFVDASRQLSYQAGVETVRALFYLAEAKYSYESVFRYLKSGMSEISDDDVDFLENYVISAGIRGYAMWSKPFTRKIYMLTEDARQKLESLRAQFMQETEASYLVLTKSSTTVKEKMTALYNALTTLRFEERFSKKAALAEEQGEFDKAREFEQFYVLLLDLLDKVVAMFGEQKMPIEELAAIMDAGLESLGITVAPLSMDQLLLGDMKRTRLPDIKILFIAGVNDTYIPEIPGERGLIHDDEKEILSSLGVELSLNAQEQVLENEFYMYLAFAKPKSAIYFTYAAMGNDGGPRRPSEVITHIHQLYPKLKEKKYLLEERRVYFNWDDSRAYLCEGIRIERERGNDSLAFHELLRYGMKEESSRAEVENLWNDYMEKQGFDPLSENMTELLYGEELHGSVTRLERFMKCPYQFFCIYGLELSEREEFKMRALDFGNVFHYALKYYSSKVRNSKYQWKNVPDEVQENWMREAMENSVDERLSEMVRSSARNRHSLATMERIFRRTVDVIKMQLTNSDFEPDHFEFKFGAGDSLSSSEIHLPNGKRMKMQGAIDRMDIYEDDASVYVRVVDYKSGNNQFEIDQMYYGLQMQLVVYMNAALEIYGKEKGKKIVPAGIYYYNMKDPIIDAQGPDEELTKKAFCMSGYTNSDDEILKHVEDANPMISVPVRLTKAGKPYKGTKVMSTEEFFGMGEHIREKMVSAGEAIYDGELDAAPYRNQKRSACDYCAYHSVCGFDVQTPGFHYREHKKLSAQEVIEKMREGDEDS